MPVRLALDRARPEIVDLVDVASVNHTSKGIVAA